ncbi:hypothetical protein V3W47_11065 [Deinococcus sp. YIM 134068]
MEKRQEVQGGQVSQEELDDLLLEALDFIWNHLTEDERAQGGEAEGA